MPAWKDRFSATEIEAVVDYIVHLNGGKIEPAQPAKDPLSTAAHPGRLLFSSQCARCHHAQGLGLAAGPTLSAQSTWPGKVQAVRRLTLKDGETLPSYLVSEAQGLTIVLDLTDPTPIRRSLETAEIASRGPAQWSHPPVPPDDWTRIQAWLMLP